MQTVELSKEVVVNTQTLQTSKSEITALRSRLQALEIELQSQQSLVKDECRLSFFFYSIWSPSFAICNFQSFEKRTIHLLVSVLRLLYFNCRKRPWKAHSLTQSVATA